MSCCCSRYLLENTAALHVPLLQAQTLKQTAQPWGRMSPSWRPVLRVYLLSALPCSSLFDRHSADKSLAFSHQCMLTHTPPFIHARIQQPHFSKSAASMEFFTPLTQLREENIIRRSTHHIHDFHTKKDAQNMFATNV